MKTYKTALYILLMLLGTSLSGHAQGITNTGYITGNTNSFMSLSGNTDLILQSASPDQFSVGNLTVNRYTTLQDDSYLTVQTALTMNDTLVLEATSSGNASLITNGTVSGTGTAQQHLVADEWHMVSPMVSSSVSGVYTGDYLYYWKESDSLLHWISIVNKTLNPGEGYFAYAATSISSPTDVKFEGTFNTGDQSPAISYTPGLGHGKGWNLLGNPFPSAIQWDNTWTKTNVDATVYVWDGSAGNYVSYNYSTGLGGLTNGEIMPGQGFWIKANATSPSITIPNNKRLHSTQSFLKTSGDMENILEMRVSNENGHDYAVFRLDPMGTEDFNPAYDAYKLSGLPEVPSIYLIKGGEKASAALYPQKEEGQTIRIGFVAPKSGANTIYFDKLDSFGENTFIYLLDKEDGSYTLLNDQPAFTFFASKGTIDDRFELHFSTSPLDTDENVQKEDDVKIFAYRNQLYLRNNSDSDVKFQVITLLGKEIKVYCLAAHTTRNITLPVKDQYIIVQAISGSLNKAVKVSLH